MKKFIYGRPMILPIVQKGLGSTLVIYGERELDQREILRCKLKPGSTVLDLGANIGYYCLVELELIGKNGKIYAYEPDSRNIKYLKKNVELNNAGELIEIFQEALSDFDGLGVFHVAERDHLNSMQISKDVISKALSDRDVGVRKYIGKVEVPTRDICKILMESDRQIDFIRMDIEGHEVTILKAILRGLESNQLGSRAPKSIVFEPHSWEYSGEPNDMFIVLKSLSKYGYKVTMLGTRNEPHSPVSKLGYKPYMCIKEKRGMVRGVFVNLNQDDAINLISSVDGVTTAIIERRSAY